MEVITPGNGEAATPTREQDTTTANAATPTQAQRPRGGDTAETWYRDPLRELGLCIHWFK